MYFIRLPLTIVAITVLSFLTVLPAFATDRGTAASNTSPAKARSLDAEQLAVIRGISRHVLAAKRSGVEDTEDAAQLAELRASVEQLLASDLNPSGSVILTLEGQETDEQRGVRERVAIRRDVVRKDAGAVAERVRRRAESRAAHASSRPDIDSRSAGLPMGEQRARLFHRWVEQLDAALLHPEQDARVTELRTLNDQLRSDRHGFIDAPRSRGTPTLQAMPAGPVPREQRPSDQEGK